MKKTIIMLSTSAALLLGATMAQAGVAVIAHPSTKVNSLTADQVSQLFLGRINQLPDGTVVNPLDVGEGSPLRGEFIDKVLGKNEQQMRSYWSRMIFTGKAQPPRVMNSASDVLRAVASTPGYIGYVDSKDAGDKVKVLYRAD